MTNPILHDKSEHRYDGGELRDSRNVVYGNGANPTNVDQRNVSFDGKKVDRDDEPTLLGYKFNTENDGKKRL